MENEDWYLEGGLPNVSAPSCTGTDPGGGGGGGPWGQDYLSFQVKLFIDLYLSPETACKLYKNKPMEVNIDILICMSPPPRDVILPLLASVGPPAYQYFGTHFPIPGMGVGHHGGYCHEIRHRAWQIETGSW